ncbi:MAG: CBS domain-containing protein [Deltaproteobacteria bacterium]|nr:CBS domain-containing protein [Deltaproteobacteria bacterium]MBW1944004.1 CBS domain-containing protein [Deltaproteobacteria bacterium]
MLVKNWMSKTVVTVDVNGSMNDAMRLLKENHIAMLPVMKKGELIGVVTDRDLKHASASDATTLEVHELLYLISKIKIKDIMPENLVTVPHTYTMEEAAEILLKNKISGMPVVDEKKELVGVITKDDIFRVLISLTGIGKTGIQFAMQVEDRPGSIKDVTDIIRAHGGRMLSILSAYDGVPEGHRKVYIRCYAIDRSKLDTLKDQLGKESTLLYMVDHRENRREIYS